MDAAFWECRGLTSVTIPSSITTIGNEIFFGCDSLTSIHVESGNTVYDSRNGCNAIIETSTNTLIAGCKNTMIPNTIAIIGRRAFCGCISLTLIAIPNSVISIEYEAFAYCDGLTSITIPSSVTSIDNSFRGCRDLASIVVEAGNTVYDSRNGCNAIIETATNRLIAGYRDCHKQAYCWLQEYCYSQHGNYHRGNSILWLQRLDVNNHSQFSYRH